jgi:hypothetical protein
MYLTQTKKIPLVKHALINSEKMLSCSDWRGLPSRSETWV